MRVSSPDRVIFPRPRRAQRTKLDVVDYYLAVGEGILRALMNRPTTLERWPKGVYDEVVRATRQDPRGDAFYQKRIPKGAPDYVETARITFPSGRHRRRGLPDRAGGRRVGGADRHDHVPPVAGAPRRRRPPRRAAHRPRPAAGHRLRRRGAGGRRGARAARGPRLARLPEDLAATAACTSTCGSSRAGPSPTCGTPPSRSAASWSAGRPAGHHQLVEGGARRADLRRLQPERPRPHDRLGLQPAAAARRARSPRR